MRAAVLAATLLMASSAAQARTTVYAVAIGNNAPPLASGEELTSLRYADDDAVRYFQFFSRFAERSYLLSVLDAQTQKRYPNLLGTAQAPTLRLLREIIRELAAAMRADLARGDHPTLLLAYSGHGAQTPEGEAFLTLADGGLTKKILYEEILASLPASFVHLFVDACHAEAVVGARGLFHREVDAATARLSPAESSQVLEAESLRRFPHVGALLATTADQQSHEWSRIESGVFTHELLSGLSGAADVNGDGVIEYSEIQAFVASANADIHDPRALPRVVAYPPAVNPRAPLVDRAWLKDVAFLEGDLSLLGHFHVELENGQRYLDAHLSPEIASSIALPSGQASFVVVGAREAELKPTSDAKVKASALDFRVRDASSRGSIGSTLHAALFRSAFSPAYYKGFVDSIGAPRVSFEPELVASSSASPLRKPLAIGALAVAAASFVAMATTTGLALKAQHDYQGTSLQREAAETQDRYVRCRNVAIGTGVGAAVAGVAAALLWPRAEPNLAISPVVSPQGGIVVAAFAW